MFLFFSFSAFLSIYEVFFSLYLPFLAFLCISFSFSDFLLSFLVFSLYLSNFSFTLSVFFPYSSLPTFTLICLFILFIFLSCHSFIFFFLCLFFLYFLQPTLRPGILHYLYSTKYSMICCPSDNIAGRPRADIRTWAGQFRSWNTDHFRPPNLFSFLTIPFRSFFLLRSLCLFHFMFLYLCLLLSVSA